MSLRFGDWTVFKTGPWGQGPVFLQQLALLPDELGPFLGIEHVHTVVEGAKLAFADRDAWYGDSAPVPLELLLSREYAEARRALIGAHASAELRPGGPSPRYPSVREGLVGDAEPTRGDTCHLDVADRFGNLVERDAERRLAAVLARDRRPRLRARHPRADVLARGRAGVVA